MGYYVRVNNKTTKKYEAVDEKAFKNFLAFARGLKFQKLNYVDGDNCKETYYDTPAHLLTKSGIILSRFEEGITSLYTTPFSVDLENIINSAIPTMEVVINAQVYEVVSGTGMRARVALENKHVRNFETNRKYKVQSMTLKLIGNTELYANDFNEFNDLIQKNCKDLMPIDESQYDWAVKVTKPIIIEKKPKEKKKAVKF